MGDFVYVGDYDTFKGVGEWDKQATQIEQAIIKTLEAGFRTGDIYQQGDTKVGTIEFTDAVLRRL